MPRLLPLLLLLLTCPLFAQSTRPAASGKLPFIDVDVAKHQARVQCESIQCPSALEFFCCVAGTNEYEAVLRSKVRPSHLHLALLMCGLEPGEPVHYDPATQKWLPPHGPALKISCQFQKDGKIVTVPAESMMRDLKTKKPTPPFKWVFVGSRMIQGQYAGDQTGYLVSVVNFELTVIDIADLASSANETLEWGVNPDVCPPKGTPVTMIIEPANPPAAPTMRR